MLNELQHLRPLNAGDRNRTGTVSLQQDFKLQQIYSLSPLATRESAHSCQHKCPDKD